LWLASAALLLLGVASGAFGVVLPSIRDDYAVSNTALGLLFLMSMVGYLVSALASGAIAGRFGRQRLLVAGMATFGGGYLLFGLRPVYAGALLTRLIASLGVGSVEAGINTALATQARSRTHLNTAHAFWGIGALLGPPFAALLLAAEWGWPRVFLIFAALSVPLVACFAWPRPAPAADAPLAGAAPPLPERHVPAADVRATVRHSALFLLTYVGVEASLGAWGYTLLTEGYHQQTRLAGLSISGYWLGLTLGRLILARLAARRGVDDRRLIYLCIVVVAGGLLLVGSGVDALVASGGLALTGFALGPLYPTGLSALGQRLPPARMASAVGLVTSLSVLGAAIGPWVAGIIAQ
jgi:fucose permease